MKNLTHCRKTGETGVDSRAPGWQEKGREREPPRPFLFPASSRFIFVSALFQLRGPDYLGAWNSLQKNIFRLI